MNYFGDSINTSATVAERAGANIESGAGIAVKYDGNGDVVACSTAGEAALGVLIAQTGSAVKGDAVCVQIKDVALWKSGAAFAKGALLATDNKGCAVTAGAGNFIMGMALGASGAAGQLVPVQLAKCGYKG